MTGEIVDVAYAMRGRSLPVDHAHALSEAIQDTLDWFGAEDSAGLHLVHVAESGNGWLRPETAHGQVLQLSRRTRLRLRLPRRRVEDALRLEGAVLDVGGHELRIGSGAVRRLGAHATLFARHVVAEHDNEVGFLDAAVVALQDLGISQTRLVCGRMRVFATPSGDLATRGLLVTDLEPRASLSLQGRGLGPGRKLGCGLFTPHKSLDAVSPGP